MRSRTLSISLLAAALVAGLLAPAAIAATSLERVVVVLRDGVSRPAAAAADLVGTRGGSVSQVWTVALKGFAAQVPSAAIEGLRNDPRVVSVEPDSIFTASAETIPTGLDRIEDDKKLALGTGTVNYASASVAVAVIDSGIANLTDLNVVGWVDCLGSSGCVTGGTDVYGHGTHVAGTIGAKDNGSGVVGVIPGVKLYSVKVLDDTGSGPLSAVIAGVNWVAARPSTITTANMSLGGPASSSIDTAVRNLVAAGVTVAVAAGNSGADAKYYSPARVTEAITVGAIADGDGKAGGAGTTCRSGEVDDRLATFSNYGSVVDIAAPGVCIQSLGVDGTIKTMSGTSMASPHVAGAAALYKVQYPSATPAAIQSALKAGSPWSAAQASVCGYTLYGGRSAGPLLMLSDPCDTPTGFGATIVVAPAAFSKTSPTSGATAVALNRGNLTVSWQASAGAATYVVCMRLFGATTSSCSSPITGLSQRFSKLLAQTKYEWQVTATNTAGSVGANSGTWWSFTTA